MGPSSRLTPWLAIAALTLFGIVVSKLPTKPQFIEPALAQSCPSTLQQGAILTPAQWCQAFQGKVDYPGAPVPTYTFGQWTPTIAGQTTAGAPTYSVQVGSYEQLGRQIDVRFSVTTTGLGGATGNILVTNLPFVSSTITNDFGSCFFNAFSGWTAAAGFTWIAGTIQPNTSTIQIVENGSTKTSQQSAVTEWAAASTIVGHCQYHI